MLVCVYGDGMRIPQVIDCFTNCHLKIRIWKISKQFISFEFQASHHACLLFMLYPRLVTLWSTVALL